MLFTKADLIAGFTEFFDDLDRERRAQVWGTTFDLARDGDDPAAAFAGDLRALVERLNARLFDRLQAERNPDRRALIAMFPGQVASLEPVLMDFLQAAFGGTRDDPAALLRGVYFTSGTQEGTPIDRLTGTLARALGVDQTRAQSLQPVQGRSYFLERLLKEVIFGEAMLVAHGPAAARRRLVLRTAGYAVPALLVVATAAVLWQVQRTGQREIDAASAALAGYEQTARSLPLDPVADDDLARLAPLLDQARALPRRRRRTVLAAGRTVAAREARCIGARRLSPCARMGAAAAPDVAAGDPVARQPRPPRLPLRGDARLSDARQCRPARRVAGARMDEAGLADGLSRCRLRAAA